MKKLENIIESILFISGDPVSISLLKDSLDIDDEQFNNILDKLKNKYDDDSGIKLLATENKLGFFTNEDYHEEITKFFNFDKEKYLSRAALEVLSIVAYKQPITKAEIDEIRGVKSDYIVSKLVNDEFLYVSDKLDAPGLPNLYSTTEKFLFQFNLTSLEDLPKVNIEEIEI